MGCRLQNRSWGNVKDPSTEIVAWSRHFSPIQWFVVSNLHSFFCRLVNLTLRPCFSRVLGISIQTRNPRVRDILQSDPLTEDFPKCDASRSWPPISTSPKWYRSRQYTCDLWHKGILMQAFLSEHWVAKDQRVANINPESRNHDHSEPSHFLNFPHRRFIETFTRMGTSVRW